MIDRALLMDIGFILGKGWDHEVWCYDGDFWVHYEGEFGGLEGKQIDGDKATRREFFAMFLECIVNEAVESATYDERCD